MIYATVPRVLAGMGSRSAPPMYVPPCACRSEQKQSPVNPQLISRILSSDLQGFRQVVLPFFVTIWTQMYRFCLPLLTRRARRENPALSVITKRTTVRLPHPRTCDLACSALPRYVGTRRARALRWLQAHATIWAGRRVVSGAVHSPIFSPESLQ
jgi:hypothetical protein